MTQFEGKRAIDPVYSLISSCASRSNSHPIPLISTRYEICIDGGFAVVETRRVFRNDEACSIEATLTFPVPVQAVLFSLEAEHDGRTLKAVARKRAAAREIYEDAIEDGKAAVLHEELLRGIHMLSVAHVAPGAEITVTIRWATTLTYVGGHWQLRVPLTVGHVYGQSPLSDADAIESGGAHGLADVHVRCQSGRLKLFGANFDGGPVQVPLNAPIDLEVAASLHCNLSGAAGDGGRVELEITPLPEERDSLDLAVLVDRSGSMGEACVVRPQSTTKHDAVIQGLTALAARLRKGDTIDLWEFDDSLGHIGSTRDERPHGRSQPHDGRPAAAFEQLVRRLHQPGGGTQIGGALEGVLSKSGARDVLLVTDGKSYALDIQKLARFGRRIAVVLVGEDSLEANVGHLAAITGGSVFVASSGDIATTVAAAAETLRSCALDVRTIETLPESIEVVRGGAIVKASWQAASHEVTGDVISSGVAAYAAGLAIARMNETAAAEFAEHAGLASHLTSLVLVDEAAADQESVPAMRKVRLPSPRTAVAAIEDIQFAIGAARSVHPSRRRAPLLKERSMPGALERSPGAARLDWDAAPAELLQGDLSSLDAVFAEWLREIAERPEVSQWAGELSLEPIVIVIAALAYRDRHRNRTAARIARKVFGEATPEWIGEITDIVQR